MRLYEIDKLTLPEVAQDAYVYRRERLRVGFMRAAEASWVRWAGTRSCGLQVAPWRLLGARSLPLGYNAPMESFWGTLKNKLAHHRKFETQQQAIEEITEYIEIFYNRQRKQERLGYLSPAAFTQRYYQNMSAT